MFSGIVTAIGRVSTISMYSQDMRIWIESEFLRQISPQLGDSIAINGVCLTVVEKKEGQCAFDVSAFTQKCTTLQTFREGQLCNLEEALRMGQTIGGHLVSGHVDGVGIVRTIIDNGRGHDLTIEINGLSQYLPVKGSVCLDGISLTITKSSSSVFGCTIIPHTYAHTIIQTYRVGQSVNIEVDQVARYLVHAAAFLGGPVKAVGS